MNKIILANALALFGAGLMAGIGLLKTRRQILLVQCLQFCIMGSANLILGGVTGFLSAMVSIVRNLICAKRRLTLGLKLAFIGTLCALSLYANTMGLLGLLPIASACLYTWFLDTEDELRLKLVLIASQVFWVIYDFSLMNYTAFLFDLITIVTNAVGIAALRKTKR